MSFKLKNIALAFKNTRTRTMVIVAILIILLGFTAGFKHFFAHNETIVESSVDLKATPNNIQSIPGGLDQAPSSDYQRLQQQQNLQEVALAEKTNTSVMPTLLESSEFDTSKSQLDSGNYSACCQSCLCCKNNLAACSSLSTSPYFNLSLQPSVLRPGTLIYDMQSKIIGQLTSNGSVRDFNGKIIAQVGPDGLVRNENDVVIGSAAVPAIDDPIYDPASHLIARVFADAKARNNRYHAVGNVAPDGLVHNKKGAVIGKTVVLKLKEVGSGIAVYDEEGHLVGTVGPEDEKTVRNIKGHVVGQIGSDGIVRDSDGKIIAKTGVNTVGAPIYNEAGEYLGTVASDGKLRDTHNYNIGEVSSDGIARDSSGKIIGKTGINTTGSPVYDADEHLMGTVCADGKIRDDKANVIAHVGSNGIAYDLTKKVIGRTGISHVGSSVYDAKNNFLGKIDSDDKVRDVNNNLLGKVDREGIVRDKNGKIIAKAGVSAIGAPIYDAKDNWIGTVGLNGDLLDAKGNQLGKVDSYGISRDANGIIIGKTGVSSAGAPVYNKQGHLVGTIAADGHVRDAHGNVLGKITHGGLLKDQAGEVIARTGVNRVGAPVYDKSGDLIGYVGPDASVLDQDDKVLGHVSSTDGVLHSASGFPLGYASLKGGLKPVSVSIPGAPVYDSEGHLIGTVSTGNEVRDAQARVIGSIDPDGVLRNKNHQLLGRIGATAPGVPIYNKQGHLIGTAASDGRIRNSKGEVIAYVASDGVARDIKGNYLGSTNVVTRGKKIGTAFTPYNSVDSLTQANSVKLPSNPSDANNAALQAILDRQAEQISAQKAEQLQQQMQANMSTQANQLFAAWVTPTQQYVAGMPSLTKNLSLEKSNNFTGNFTSTSLAPSVKAGTIMYAVLLTAVNSDEPGPVLAEIVQGKFKGARLIGTLSNQKEKVLLSFSTLTLPNIAQSIPVNTVAIDENTTRTALSSYTNNHYWLRYGTLFASAFIQGYGQSFLNAGSPYAGAIIINPSDKYPTPSLNPRDRVFVGLGQVGVQYASALNSVFNTPPTVHVYSGTPMGILFLSDLTALPN